MISYDKIQKNVDKDILNFINKLVSIGDIERLNSWITDLKQEIARRNEQKEFIPFSYYCEQEYLNYVLGGFKNVSIG